MVNETEINIDNVSNEILIEEVFEDVHIDSPSSTPPFIPMSSEMLEELLPPPPQIGWAHWLAKKTWFWGLCSLNFIMQELMIGFDNTLLVDFFNGSSADEAKQTMMDLVVSAYYDSVYLLAEEYQTERDEGVSPKTLSICFMLALPAAINFAFMLYHLASHPYQNPNEEAHEHSALDTLKDCVVIGTPFFGILAGASLEVSRTLFPNLPNWALISIATGTGGIGMLSNTFINGYFVHEAADQSGGGIKGFLKGLLQAFIIKTFFNDKPLFEKLKLIWIQMGIVLGHIAEGYLAATLIVEYLDLLGLEHLPEEIQTVIVDTLNVLLPFLLTMYEGLPEARCVHSQQNSRSGIKWPREIKNLEEWTNFLKSSPRVFVMSMKWFSAIIHSLVTVVGAAMMFGPTTAGPWNGLLYNSLIFGGSLAILGPGNGAGTYAMLDYVIERFIEKDLPKILADFFGKDLALEYDEVVYEPNYEVRLPQWMNNLRKADHNESRALLPVNTGDAQRASCFSGVFTRCKEGGSKLLELCPGRNSQNNYHEIPLPKISVEDAYPQLNL